MVEFDIMIHSFSEIREFIETASTQPFEVMVGNDHQEVSGKNYIGMACLDFDRPLHVTCGRECDSADFEQFMRQISHFLAN